MKYLKFLSYLITTCWSLAGLIIMGSIFLGQSLWFINLFIGLFFIFIGFYFFKKESCFLELYKHSTIEDEMVNKNIKLELMLLLFFSFFGVIVLSAVYSRVFDEGFAVFG